MLLNIILKIFLPQVSHSWGSYFDSALFLSKSFNLVDPKPGSLHKGPHPTGTTSESPGLAIHIFNKFYSPLWCGPAWNLHLLGDLCPSKGEQDSSNLPCVPFNLSFAFVSDGQSLIGTAGSCFYPDELFSKFSTGLEEWMDVPSPLPC